MKASKATAPLKKTAKTLGTAASRADFTAALMLWGPGNGRTGLPWQVKDAYAVWVSEIMLQQTQVETAKPYFVKFMAAWPDVGKLAAAEEDDVLAAWAGLGYYRRAKFLHKAAKEVVLRWGGVLPKTAAALMSLPGIGRSTAAAISSIVNGEAVPILDGNVVRVLTRYFGCEADVAQASTQKTLWVTAESVLSRADPGAYTQFIMDLGATVCTPKSPSCADCPMSARCAARRKGWQARLPMKSKAEKVRRVEHEVWRLFYDGARVALMKNMGKTGVWQSMHVFAMDPDALRGLALTPVLSWSFNHAFSHYDLHVDVVLERMSCEDLDEECDRHEGWACVPLRKALTLALPSPVKEVLLKILKEGTNEAIS